MHHLQHAPIVDWDLELMHASVILNRLNCYVEHFEQVFRPQLLFVSRDEDVEWAFQVHCHLIGQVEIIRQFFRSQLHVVIPLLQFRFCDILSLRNVFGGAILFSRFHQGLDEILIMIAMVQALSKRLSSLNFPHLYVHLLSKLGQLI